MYTCVSGNRMHAGDFREAVAACPLGGGFVAGEIAPAERGARATLQSHTSVVAVFRGAYARSRVLRQKRQKKGVRRLCFFIT